DYRIDKADSIRIHLANKYPERVWTHFYGAYYYLWRIYSGEQNTRTDDKFYLNLDKTLALLEKNRSGEYSYDEIHDYTLYYSLLARHALFEHSIIRSLFYLQDCLKYLKMSFGHEDEYEAFYLTSGIYNYCVAYAVEKYPVFSAVEVIFPAADKQKGLVQLLKINSSEDIILSIESAYFLLKIYNELEKNYEFAHYYASGLVEKYPENLYYRYFLFEISIELEDFQSAIFHGKKIKLAAENNPALSRTQRRYFVEKVDEVLKDIHIKKSGKKIKSSD
ncbi:MAG: hypothetical protein IIA45_14250, partial [Bacteroidetes bacterium]|nr:hypothetical protein [Bacteroidota bacterium]